MSELSLLREIDSALIEGRFDDCDRKIASLQNEIENINLSYGLLSITFLDKKQLPHRRIYFDLFKSFLKQNYKKSDVDSFIGVLE